MGTGLKADLIRNANETSSKKKNQTNILLALKRWGEAGEEKLQGKFASTLSWQKR